MEYDLITLWAYRTGAVENATTIRNGLAFDLTQVDLRDRALLRASLHLPKGLRSREISEVRLSDPGREVGYGRAGGREHLDAVGQVALNAVAIADLRQASGAFFSLDVILENAAGVAQWLPAEDAKGIMVTAIAEVAARAVAA